MSTLDTAAKLGIRGVLVTGLFLLFTACNSNTPSGSVFTSNPTPLPTTPQDHVAPPTPTSETASTTASGEASDPSNNQQNGPTTVSPSPNLRWSNQFGSTSDDEVRSIAIGPDGSLYVAGWTEGTFPGQASAGTRDAFLRKYNSAGKELWTRQFGAYLQDAIEGVAIDRDGGIYVAGWTHGDLDRPIPEGQEADAFLRKYDPNGNPMWTQQFGTDDRDQAMDVALNYQGDVYIVGWTLGMLPDQAGRGEQWAFIRRYDAKGAELWTRQFGPDHYRARTTARGIAVDREGNAYVTGWAQGDVSLSGGDNSGRGAFIRKYDPAGKEVWTRQFGADSPVEAFDVAVDGEENVFVVGRVDFRGALDGQAAIGGNDAFIRKYDSVGDELWTRQFGGTGGGDEARRVVTDDEGNAYVAGITGGLPGQAKVTGNDDVFLRKYGPDGVELWTYQAGFPYGAQLRDLAMDATDTIYLAGSNRMPEERCDLRDQAAVDAQRLWLLQLTQPKTDSIPTHAATPQTGTLNARIAFVSDREGVRRLYMMNADGSGQTRLSKPGGLTGQPDPTKEVFSYPTGSPDGSKIAFTFRNGGRSTSNEIFVMDADGSNVTNLTNNRFDDEHPAWSPDGTTIVFTSHRDGNSDIYVISADGSNEARLTSHPAKDEMPVWSPDGSRLAFTSDRDSQWNIHVMDSDGSNQNQLTDNLGDNLEPTWSPDGSKIAFRSNANVAGDWNICVMDADGSNPTNLSNSLKPDGAPAWSPDGTQIAFVSPRDGNPEIYVMDADGSNQIRLTNNLAGDFSPTWLSVPESQ